MPSELSSAKRAEIKSKSVIGLPNTVTGKPDIVKNAIFDPVDIVATEVNRIVGETNDELTKCNDKITENKNLIEKNTTDISNIFSKLIDKIFPIGRYYISDEAKSPASLFGGTWQQIKGRTLFALDSDNSRFNWSGKEGGAERVSLEIGNMPNHSHRQARAGVGNENTSWWHYIPSSYWTEGTVGLSYVDMPLALSSGSGRPFDILPPYLTVYMWKRIA